VPPEHVLHNNTCSDLLAIAEHMLSGEIKYRKENFEEAFWELQMAATLSDDLVYDEPWGWMQPPGHALGALMLEQGRVDEAEAHFRKDMDTRNYGRCHPNNIWALKGLKSCLLARQEQKLRGERGERVSAGSAGGAERADSGTSAESGRSVSADSAERSESGSSAGGTGGTGGAGGADAELEAEIAELGAKIATFQTGDTKIEVACMCARGK
jgi:hypothetical protein